VAGVVVPIAAAVRGVSGVDGASWVSRWLCNFSSPSVANLIMLTAFVLF